MMALGRRKPIVLVTLVVAILAVVVAWRVLRISALASIGAGYAAEQTCACLFVSGRSLESCKHELDPLAQRVVRLRAGHDEVTANAFGVSKATARYQRGFGCSLEN
jgi:hypothetical protein